MSFLEMLDVVNEGLIAKGEEPIAFDSRLPRGHLRHRAAVVINGVPHGPEPRHARSASCTCGASSDGDTITIEPWRARAFPVVKDLVVDRSAFDRIIAAGGFISVNTGGAPDGNAHPDPARRAETGDGRGRLHRLRRVRGGLQERLGDAVRRRQGLAPGAAAAGPARARAARVVAMVEQMDAEGFGSCTNEGECEAVCPKEITIVQHRPHEPRVHPRGDLSGRAVRDPPAPQPLSQG